VFPDSKTSSNFLFIKFYSSENVLNAVSRPKQFLFAQVVVCSLCFLSCLPAAIAIYPQYGTLKTSDLEPELAKKIDAEFVTYNKGL
jgi:hypothetical protein